jgi:uncharacterized protein YwgA
MDKQDWVLLVIAAAKNKSFQPVHLQKTLFLLQQNLPLEDLQVSTFYQFEPYDYGPFCSEIYYDAEILSTNGFVHIDQPVSLSYRIYSITGDGVSKAERLMDNLKPQVKTYLAEVVNWATSLSFKQLITAIYRHYPDMKVNSVFREE